jgi:NADH-quinone oxidoreductase subunit G
MIDICPVGALTSKPFRYSARTWELSRRKSISPHDSTGANLVIQVKNNKVLRVVPFENDQVNECWIADRDRFSYESLNGPERLLAPMIKQDGQWRSVDWQVALDYVARGLKQIKAEHGAGSIGALVSPHSTLEELALAARLVRGLGSENIDYRLRNAEFEANHGVRWLGMQITNLSTLQRVLVVGSNVRKDHPLFALRLRQAVRRGAQLHRVNATPFDWAMNVATDVAAPSSEWASALASIASAVAGAKGLGSPTQAVAGPQHVSIANSLLSGERKAILLGNAAAHHAKASSLLALANWIGEHTGASVGYLTEASNTVGAQLAGALPGSGGMNAGQMLSGSLKAALLLNTEPEFDSAAAKSATQSLQSAEMVVTLSPFRCNLEMSDVLLPIAPFTETSGTFVNAEGRVQSFHAAVKPAGDARPGWKVIRVLGSILGLTGFEAESAQEVVSQVLGGGNVSDVASRLSNQTSVNPDLSPSSGEPCVATIYGLDSMVRRASSLQLTADAKLVSVGASA